MLRRKTFPYTAIVQLDGRHPYLENGTHYPSRQVDIKVVARSWAQAEREALNRVFENSAQYRCWRYWVCGIAKGPRP